MKKIFLVDDHPMLRDGLIRLIGQKSGCHVCGESASGAEALDAIPRLEPDLVMLDITLPDRNGLELIKDLQVLVPGIRILVFSMHDEMIYAERVMRAGAKGYLMKGAPTEKLIEAINRVLGGGIYLSGRVSEQILRCLTSNRSLDQLGVDRLTDRELEVFELIGKGKSSAQIAEQLHISPKTVDTHRANLKTKLSVPDAAALIREAVLWVEFGTASATD